MTNPEIQNLVKEASTRARKPVKSIFCLQSGAGNHHIDSGRLFQMQRDFLINNDNKLYKFKDDKGIFRLPSSEPEKNRFLKSETKRRQQCIKYFKTGNDKAVQLKSNDPESAQK